jgi:hypothetical protein
MASAPSEIHSFATEFIENLYVLPSGELLFSTFESPIGHLYTLDPTASDPKAKLVARFDENVTGLTGLSPFPSSDDELYAVSGGIHSSFSFKKGSMALYIVSLRTGTVVDSIPVPDTAVMNGMAALPQQPHILLSADSTGGLILSVDTRTRTVSVAIEDRMLAPAEDSAARKMPPIGINGLRVRGDHLYFTNSSQGTFVRVRVDEHGRRVGDFEVLFQCTDPALIYDDFAFDADGNAYVAAHPASVVKITPGGVQTTVAGGASDPLLKHPTSVALANDGKSIYVSTGGNLSTTSREGGQIIQIQL